MGMRTLSDSMRLKYSDFSKKNTTYFAKFDDQKGQLARQTSSRPLSPTGENTNSIRGRAQSASGELANSLLNNYKKYDKDYLEKQKKLWQEQEEAEMAVKEFKEELNFINEQLDYEVNWEELTWSDKARLFRYWSIFNFFGNIIQIFAALFFLFRGNFGLHISDYLSGLGCMFAYIGLV